MKLTGFPIYLVAICLSLYFLSLTFINGLNIASKLTPTNKAKEEINKYCEELVFQLSNLVDKDNQKKAIENSINSFLNMKDLPKSDKANVFLTCYEILYK
jgi:hypothetical protein